jgi:hypothetical protein
MHLAHVAFQQARGGCLNNLRIPGFEESKWQFQCLVLHHMTTDKQRRLVSFLIGALLPHMKPGALFKETVAPRHNDLGKHYGSSGQHSMSNNLPVPTATAIDGCASTSPQSIFTHSMVNGTLLDDMHLVDPTRVTREYMAHFTSDIEDDNRSDTVVHNVNDCRKCVDWKRAIRNECFGVPNSNLDLAPKPKYEQIVCVVIADWTDSFGLSSMKSNRKAVNVKSCTFGPPKESANVTNNAFVTLMGLKKATGWQKGEHQCQADVELLTQAREPVGFFHGNLQKMVPYMFL